MKNNCAAINGIDQVQYNLDDLVDLLRKRTEMYTGGSSLTTLNSFLSGVAYVLSDINDALEKKPPLSKLKKIEIVGTRPNPDFSRWVQNKFNFEAALGWDTIITAISLGFKTFHEVEDWDNLDQLASVEDHRKARELFYQLLDEYRAEKISSLMQNTNVISS